jgi:hypothetical protein
MFSEAKTRFSDKELAHRLLRFIEIDVFENFILNFQQIKSEQLI